MREFNLKEALEGKPVMTRSGQRVEELHYFKADESDWPIYCVFQGKITGGFQPNGRYLHDKISPHDLFMAPREITLWVNVYKNNDGDFYTVSYDTEVKADAVGTIRLGKAQKITVTVD